MGFTTTSLALTYQVLATQQRRDHLFLNRRRLGNPHGVKAGNHKRLELVLFELIVHNAYFLVVEKSLTN